MRPDFRILAQSTSFVVGHEFETVFLIDRRTGEERILGDHYGDPRIGLISPDESWFLVAGEGVTYFDFERGLHEFWRDEEPYFVQNARLDGQSQVRILVDPWSEAASVWLLSIPELRMKKLHDGPSLQGKPYREQVPY